MSLTVVSDTQLTELLGKGKPVVADFSADWCAPCRVLSPEISKLAASVSDEIEFVEIDVDAYPELTQKLRIMSVPTVVHFASDGAEIARSVGAVRAEQLALRLGLS